MPTRLPATPPKSSSVLVTPVGGSYYAHIGPGLADRVDILLPALPEVERGVIIEASEDTAVVERDGVFEVIGRDLAVGVDDVEELFLGRAPLPRHASRRVPQPAPNLVDRRLPCRPQRPTLPAQAPPR